MILVNWVAFITIILRYFFVTKTFQRWPQYQGEITKNVVLGGDNRFFFFHIHDINVTDIKNLCCDDCSFIYTIVFLTLSTYKFSLQYQCSHSVVILPQTRISTSTVQWNQKTFAVYDLSYWWCQFEFLCWERLWVFPHARMLLWFQSTKDWMLFKCMGLVYSVVLCSALFYFTVVSGVIW